MIVSGSGGLISPLPFTEESHAHKFICYSHCWLCTGTNYSSTCCRNTGYRANRAHGLQQIQWCTAVALVQRVFRFNVTQIKTMTVAMVCPNCGKSIDRHSSIFDETAVPDNGDVSICFGCSHISIYDNGQLRNPTSTEMYDIAGNTQILETIRRIKLIKEIYK